jgi:plasmid stabilization system protein ParE
MGEDELVEKPTNIFPECEEMVKEALDYITVNSPQQAEIMDKQFHKVLSMIGRQPGLGTRYKNGMRRIMLGKFRYFIYYKETETEVEILGIQRTSMGKEFSEHFN